MMPAQATIQNGRLQTYTLPYLESQILHRAVSYFSIKRVTGGWLVQFKIRHLPGDRVGMVMEEPGLGAMLYELVRTQNRESQYWEARAHPNRVASRKFLRKS